MLMRSARIKLWNMGGLCGVWVWVCVGKGVLGCSGGAWSEWSVGVLRMMLKNSQFFPVYLHSHSQKIIEW